jgi:predicted RNA-binding protein Jag
VVHMELADRKDVITESIGEGEERRIVVKPVL